MFKKGIFILISVIMAQIVFAGCTPPGSGLRNTSDKQGYHGQKGKYSEPNRGDGYQTEEMEFEDEDYGIDPERAVTKNARIEDDYGNDEKFFQKGTASWYGREFHGKVTASGERFDMNMATAAHRTLPFGSMIEVKNLDNNKTVRVVVNDRGPYKGNRILDLSYGAAKKLDMVRQGKALVGITVIRRGAGNGGDGANAYEDDTVEPVSDDISPAGGAYSLQIGAFYSRKNAEDLRKRVEDMTNRDVKLLHEGNLYKVRIEGLRNRNEADRFKRQLSEDDIPSYLLEH